MKREDLKRVLAGQSGSGPSESVAQLGVPDGFRVLVVDDIAINGRIEARLLEQLGIAQVDLATSGEEALRLAQGNCPNVVFTDLWMPGMDGHELLRRLRAEAEFAEVPVVGVTSDSNLPEGGDFTATVIKPVTIQKLREVFGKLGIF